MNAAQFETLRRAWQEQRDAFHAALARGDTEIQRILALLEFNRERQHHKPQTTAPPTA